MHSMSITELAPLSIFAFIQSFNQYLLSTHNVPGTVIGKMVTGSALGELQSPNTYRSISEVTSEQGENTSLVILLLGIFWNECHYFDYLSYSLVLSSYFCQCFKKLTCSQRRNIWHHWDTQKNTPWAQKSISNQKECSKYVLIHSGSKYTENYSSEGTITS